MLRGSGVYSCFLTQDTGSAGEPYGMQAPSPLYHGAALPPNAPGNKKHINVWGERRKDGPNTGTP